ncbi:F-box/FBD/LRR-repeat protein At4g00160-like isoform X2 [Euphorbia lathyris]|uniref:F-box/FBD/LRR-repeat protein At4g00160-like isoform X2 n=1 Tax=Euphorbia lathyris TaxID=212925 RepID=UPI003313FB95
MDINLPVTKDQRCSESLDIIEDRISKLPDEILGKILSYLRTKRAVATSVLSKRWEYLWTLTSDLDFCDFGLLDDEAENKNDNDYMIKMRSFQRYVDRVIFYHGGSDIGKCRLDFHNVEGVDIYLLNAISQVEYLSLTASEMSLQNIIRDSALPIFKNLKTMELRDSVGWRTPANDWKVLPNLLDSSPNLRVLIFCQGLVSLTLYRDDFNHFDWQRPESVPECLSMHLKTIEIFEFVGFPEELQIVEYLLECGKVLEKMIIHRFVLSKSTIMKKKVKRDKVMSELLSLRRNCSTGEVMSFKRSSSSCEVIFTD